MTKGYILTKAIAIAKRNGLEISNDFFTEIPVEKWIQENQDLYFALIFSHDFAICFFGIDYVVVTGFDHDAIEVDLTEPENPIGSLMSNRDNIKIPMWQYHLAQMVLSKDPLIYLKKFVMDYEQTELN